MTGFKFEVLVMDGDQEGGDVIWLQLDILLPNRSPNILKTEIDVTWNMRCIK